jgi:ABC-type glycerol-3-phosphate transport system substrate-binding protein
VPKLPLLACLSLLTTPALSADSPALSPTAQSLQIAIWYDGLAGNLAPLNDISWIFQQHHKGVVVSLNRHVTATAYPLLMRWSTIDPDSAPDLLVISSSWLAQFKDSLAPLDSVAKSAPAAKIVPPALSLFTLDGHLRAVPWSLAARTLAVRSDLLADKRLKPPATWDQVAEVAAALHSPPQLYGLGLPGAERAGGAALLQEMIWAEGDELTTPSGAVDLTGPAPARALQRYVTLAPSAQPEILTWTQPELEALFAAGRLGMVVTDTWVARSWKGVPGMPAYQVLPLPGGKQPLGHLLGDGLAVFAKSKDRELALQFAQMVLLPQAQRKLVEWGGLPVQQDLLAEAGKDPLLAALLPTVPQAHLIPPTQPAELSEALDYALYLALSGRATPEQALAAAQERLRAGATPTTPGAPPGAG